MWSPSRRGGVSPTMANLAGLGRRRNQFNSSIEDRTPARCHGLFDDLIRYSHELVFPSLHCASFFDIPAHRELVMGVMWKDPPRRSATLLACAGTSDWLADLMLATVHRRAMSA